MGRRPPLNRGHHQVESSVLQYYHVVAEIGSAPFLGQPSVVVFASPARWPPERRTARFGKGSRDRMLAPRRHGPLAEQPGGKQQYQNGCRGNAAVNSCSHLLGAIHGTTALGMEARSGAGLV